MDKERALRLGEWLTRLRPVELAVFLKWLLRVRRIETEAQGLKLLVDPASNFGKRVLRDRIYEPELTAVLPELLKPGDTFVDVGANEGWFSLLAGRLVGPSGQVLACEPQERLRPVLLGNIALNGFANVRLLPYAISDRSGKGTMSLYPSTNTGSSHLDGKARRWEKKQSVELLPLASVLAAHDANRVALLKIDVEGHELQVLRGAGEHLGKSIGAVAVETHAARCNAFDAGADAVSAFLEAKRYGKRKAGDAEIWQLRSADGRLASATEVAGQTS